jgi:hypothetical protein
MNVSRTMSLADFDVFELKIETKATLSSVKINGLTCTDLLNGKILIFR